MTVSPCVLLLISVCAIIHAPLAKFCKARASGAMLVHAGTEGTLPVDLGVKGVGVGPVCRLPSRLAIHRPHDALGLLRAHDGVLEGIHHATVLARVGIGRQPFHPHHDCVFLALAVVPQRVGALRCLPRKERQQSRRLVRAPGQHTRTIRRGSNIALGRGRYPGRWSLASSTQMEPTTNAADGIHTWGQPMLKGGIEQ